jgi:hypothetical protein
VHTNVNWEAIVAIVEVVGLLAVVVSVIYVAVQVRQNSDLIGQNVLLARSAMVHEISVTNMRFYELIAENPDLASIYRKGINSEDLDPDEVVRFESLIEVYFTYLEDSDYQFKSNLYFDEDDVGDNIEFTAPMYRDMLTCKYGSNWWDRTAKANNAPSFYNKIQRVRASWED